MKHVIFLLLVLVASQQLFSQNKNWRNGERFTPRGDLHILVIFANQQCDRLNNKYEYYCGDLSADNQTGCNDYYYTNSVPSWAMNNGFINATANSIDNDGILDAMGNTIMPYLNDPEFNVSAYYKTASFGDFIVTGDVVSVEIPSTGAIVQESNPDFDNTQPISANNPEFIDQFECGGFSRKDIVDAAFNQHPNLNPADYDNRNNFAFSVDNFRYDNSSGTSPDNILDYVAIIQKIRSPNSGNAGYISGSYQQGYTLNVLDNQNNPYKLGYHHVHKNTTTSKWWNMNLFIHEFAHNIGMDHNGGANQVVFDKFTSTGDWGMITAPVSQFWVPKAHTMWLYGWLNDADIHDIDLTQANSTDPVNIVLTDLLTSPKDSNPTNAARIKIPHTDNQYLWIENHQKIHPSGFEELNAYIPNDPWENQHTVPGLYMYITDVENNLTDPRGHNKASVLNPDKNSNNTYLLHPNGKKDYAIVFEADNITPIMEQPDGDIWEPDKVEPKLVIAKDNPIAGSIARERHRMNNPANVDKNGNPLHQNEIAYYNNYNDGNTSQGTNEYYGVKFDNYEQDKRVTHIDIEKTAFTVGDELSINGIFPILNFRRFNETPGPGQRQQEPTTLTGLKVKVESVDATGKYTLTISKDDWTFNSNKRWCDAIILPEDETLTVTGQSNLSLELSGTVNRTTPHPKNRNDPFIKNFVDPTILTAQTNSGIIIENNSCINVKEESTLKISENATLHLKSGGFVHIKDEDSKLVLDENSILHMEQNAEIIVRDGGSLVINTDNIDLDFATSKIIIESGGILTTTTGQSFNFDGPGQLVIEEGAIIDMPFNLVGESLSHTAILFNYDNSTSEYALIDMEHDFYLTDCKVWHNGGSKIIINDSKVKFDNVNFIDGNGSSTAFVGNNLRSFDCKDSKFDDFDVGIILNDYTAPTGNPNDPCNNPSNPIFKVRNCEFNYTTNTGVSCINVYKLYAVNNIFNNDVLGNVNQKAIYCTNSGAEVINNEIDKFDTGVHFNGANSNSTLQLSSGDISYCNTAIRTELANATIKYCAKIHHNFYGIHSTASGIKQITIGRKGGTSITDNEVGIKGYNIIVDIDAISAKSANAGVHHPNDLSNNNLFFDLSYSPNVTLPTGLSARGNYWGWYNGCGAGADETGAYLLPFPLDDSQWLYYQPTAACLNTGLICNGAAEPNSNGNITGFNTNFNLIYNISNDYLEEEAYNYAHFGFSLVADFEDEPIYNSLELNDQNTVILSKVQQTTIEPYLPPADACRVGENPGLMFPDVSLFSLESEAYELIESVSPNPFNNYITLSTFIKSDAYVIEIFNAYDINGRSLMQLKTENNRLKIDVSNLKPGIYAIKVTDKKGNTDYAEILKAY